MPTEQRLPCSDESNSENAVDSVDDVDSPRGQCSRKRKQSRIKGRREPSKDTSSLLGETKMKTPAKKKAVTSLEAAKANGMRKLMTKDAQPYMTYIRYTLYIRIYTPAVYF
jgi:hypothetical protein